MMITKKIVLGFFLATATVQTSNLAQAKNMATACLAAMGIVKRTLPEIQYKFTGNFPPRGLLIHEPKLCIQVNNAWVQSEDKLYYDNDAKELHFAIRYDKNKKIDVSIHSHNSLIITTLKKNHKTLKTITRRMPTDIHLKDAKFQCVGDDRDAKKIVIECPAHAWSYPPQGKIGFANWLGYTDPSMRHIKEVDIV